MTDADDRAPAAAAAPATTAPGPRRDAAGRGPAVRLPGLGGAPLEIGDGPWGGIELDGSRPDASVVRLWGDVDASLRDQASDVMAQVVLRSGPVVIGAADVGFLDSTGLAFVLQLVKAGEEEGRAVVLEDPPAHLTDLVAMVGMTDRVPVRRSAPVEA
ncbi:STAS domain-containing protein [Actinotalea solisilvae]|uniref:STAS domain-containing protein n=1 Tax=Actinotalea solisilvae TaxID=2072922 RepID=UPI0018F18034|nr:STAS domain-containing protein [Actinotalea solisilvae]